MGEGKIDLPEDLFPSKSGVESWKLKGDIPRGNYMDKELIGIPDDLKDPLITENIPLTPQWLYARNNDSKTGHSAFSGEIRGQHNLSHGMPSDPLQKDGWRLEGSHEKKDWRRAAPEMDINRRWREEERDTGLLSRRERKKEGDRETDYRKTTASSREPDSRSAPISEKWYEGSARSSGHENRRDSKWSSRWGPEDKEELRTEKKTAADKEKDDTQSEKQVIVGDKWRPRHRQEVQSGGSATYRAAPGFGLEKGRTDGQPTGFASGRGRANPSGSFRPSSAGPIGFKSEGVAKNDTFRYPRGKLLDIYRRHSLLSTFDALPDGFEEIPPITQPKRAEPLAFVTPDAEEEAVVQDMWKGKIISSDVPSNRFVRERMSTFKDSESEEQGSSDPAVISETTASEADMSYTDHERKAASDPRLSLHTKSGQNIPQEPISALNFRSKVPESDNLTRIATVNDPMASPLGIPPEEMSFLYRDPQGEIQGPFLGVDIISWFDQGFFGTDLPVRLLDAPEGTSFKALGEVMPQLKHRATNPNPTTLSESSDFNDGNPNGMLDVPVSNALIGQRISRHSDRVDLQDHSFARSRPDAGPDVEEVIYRGRFASNSQNMLSEDASLHPLGLFLSELEAHQKRPLSTNLSGISNAAQRQDVHDTWPNAIGRHGSLNQNPNPMAAPQLSHLEQDSGHLALDHQMLLQQIQLQHLQQQDLHQRHPLDQLHSPHHNHQLIAPHPSEIDNLLKLQFQQQQLLHLQQKQQQQQQQQQQQKDQILMEQLLQRQMHESTFMPSQTIQEELMFQERLHHHLKQQSLQQQRQIDPAMEQLLRSRFMHRQQHPEELEILEALRAKQNQSLMEQQQLILRLQQEQQFQQLQEERHHLARTGPSRHWAQMDRLVQGAHQNRPPLSMHQAMYEPRLEGLGLQDQFGSNVNAVRPNQFSQMPEPDGPFQMRLEAERMRRNFRANLGPEDPTLWASPGNDEKSARLLMGLLGNRDMVNSARDPSSHGIRDSNWAFNGPAADPYNTVPDGQTSGIESGNRFQYQSMPGEMLEDSSVDFFDAKEGIKSKKSWSNIKSAPEVLGGSMGFYNMEMKSDGDPSGELMNTDRLLRHHPQGSLSSQDPLPQFMDNIMEGGVGGSADLRRSPGEVDPLGASFMDMLLTAKKQSPAEADSASVSISLEADSAAAAAARASNKKKGKKGRQIDPSLLGFKVHSNRIMMGEIQRPEDL